MDPLQLTRKRRGSKNAPQLVRTSIIASYNIHEASAIALHSQKDLLCCWSFVRFQQGISNITRHVTSKMTRLKKTPKLIQRVLFLTNI